MVSLLSEENFKRLSYVLLGIAPKAVRIYFDDEFDPEVFYTFLLQNKEKLRSLRTRNIISKVHWSKLFERGSVSSKDLDIQTMICLIRNLIPVPISNDLPHPEIKSIGADLSRINYYWKMIVHSQDTNISDEEFETVKNDLKGPIGRLSGGKLDKEFDFLFSDITKAGKNEHLQDGKGEPSIAFSNGRRCDVCDFKGLQTVSLVWCMNCDESLCQQCLDHHLSNKLFQYHDCIGIKEFLENPSLATTICSEHNEPLEFFCEAHFNPICHVCAMSEHKFCQFIKPIQLVLKQSDTIRHGLHEKLETLLQKVNSITQNVQTNLQTFDDQKRKVRSQLKRKLKSATENVEKQCLHEISHHENTTNVLFKNLSKQQKEIKRISQHLTVQKNQNIRSFITMLEAGEKIKKQEEKVQKLLKDSSVNIVLVDTDIDLLAMKNIICSVREISLSSLMDKLVEIGAQDKKGKEVTKITDFSLDKTSNEIEIRGCAIINENVVCFADRGNNRLLFMTVQGYQKEIKLSCEPVDITKIDSIRIAVSLFNNTIKIMNIETWKWDEFSFSDENTLGGLDFQENQIICRVGGIGYLFIDLTGKVQQLVTIEGSNMPYVSVAQDKLYSARWDTGEIFCFDLSGKRIWTFKDKFLINPPNGITTDMEGNAYVTGSFSNNVICISADGKESKEIISSGENLKNPIAIDYDKKTDRLLVSVASGLGCLFSIKSK